MYTQAHTIVIGYVTAGRGCSDFMENNEYLLTTYNMLTSALTLPSLQKPHDVRFARKLRDMTSAGHGSGGAMIQPPTISQCLPVSLFKKKKNIYIYIYIQ